MENTLNFYIDSKHILFKILLNYIKLNTNVLKLKDTNSNAMLALKVGLKSEDMIIIIS